MEDDINYWFCYRKKLNNIKNKKNCPLCRRSFKKEANIVFNDWLFSHIKEE